MYYAVQFVNGMNPMGNHGLQKLRHKSVYGIFDELESVRKLGGEIFIMSDFTQEMCEMSNSQLWAYCINNYYMYIRHDCITKRL